jgi:hypothetical protein
MSLMSAHGLEARDQGSSLRPFVRRPLRLVDMEDA